MTKKVSKIFVGLGAVLLALSLGFVFSACGETPKDDDKTTYDTLESIFTTNASINDNVNFTEDVTSSVAQNLLTVALGGSTFEGNTITSFKMFSACRLTLNIVDGTDTYRINGVLKQNECALIDDVVSAGEEDIKIYYTNSTFYSDDPTIGKTKSEQPFTFVLQTRMAGKGAVMLNAIKQNLNDYTVKKDANSNTFKFSKSETDFAVLSFDKNNNLKAVKVSKEESGMTTLVVMSNYTGQFKFPSFKDFQQA